MKKMSRFVALSCLVGAIMTGILACGSEERARAREEALDTLTRRQKDSLVSTLPIPGAGAVGKAMSAVDSANARTRRHDSIIH